MIVRDQPSLFELLFAVRGSMVPVIAPRIAFLVLVAAAMVALHKYFALFPAVDGFGLAIFGVALSLFLSFRNSAAYDRWWEARRQWGGLLADVRNLARDLSIFVTHALGSLRASTDGIAFPSVRSVATTLIIPVRVERCCGAQRS